MGADEVGTLKGLTERRALLDGLIGEHRGRVARAQGRPTLGFQSNPAAQLRAVGWLSEAQSSVTPFRSLNNHDRRPLAHLAAGAC
jgi:adenylate cyclase